MSLPSGTIDLGELPHGEQVELDTLLPVRQRLRRWGSHRGTWQVAGAATVTTFALLTAAGGAAPARPALALQFTVHSTGFEIDQDTLYSIEDPPDGDETLRAYRLADGAVQWEYASPDLDGAWVTDQSGVLLVLTVEATESDIWPMERTTRLDPATGRPLWTLDGSPIGSGDGRMLLAETLPPEQPPMDDNGYTPPYRITAVDLATGVRQWQRELPESGRQQIAEDRLVTISPDGQQLTSYDIRTGEPVASIAREPQEQVELQVIGSLAIVVSGWETEPTWTAYDVDTLASRWTLESAGEVGTWPHECGALICLDGRVPRAIDPATGRTVWTADWAPGDRDRWFGVLGLESPELAGHLVITRAEDGGLHEHSWLVDARTGELVLDLGAWDLAAGGYPMEQAMADPMLTWSDDGAVWVGRLRRDLSGVDPIGAIDAALPDIMPYHQCTAWPSHVMCAVEVVNRSEGAQAWELTVWRMR